MTRADLIEERMNIITRKNALDAQKRELKSKIYTTTVHSTRNKLYDQMNGLEAEMNCVMKELAEINLKIARFHEQESVIPSEHDPRKVDGHVIDNAMADLLKKWKAMAEDRTRIASVRVVAGEVAQDLQKIVNLMNMKKS